MSPGDAPTAALVGTQDNRGDEGVGDQPSACVRRTEAPQAPALARQALDAGRLQHVRLALTQMPGIRAQQQPNEGGGWVRHRIRL